MIVQEPVKAAIWHCLNHYDYSDAVFLSERLYAEVDTDDSLFLLATSYYRNGQKDQAFHVLQDKTESSPHCRYLLGMCAYDLGKYAEAEAALLQKRNSSRLLNIDEVCVEYGEQASFALALLAKIAARTEKNSKAAEGWRRALKLNPFQWSSFEHLCKIGEHPNPSEIFHVNDVDNFSMCHGSNISNIESVIITNSTPVSSSNANDNQDYHLATPNCVPNQIITNNINLQNHSMTRHMSPDDSPMPHALWMSGLAPINSRVRLDTSPTSASPQPSFGHFFAGVTDLYAGTPNLMTQSKLSESNNAQRELPPSLATKRMTTTQVVDQLISSHRKEPILQNSKPVFSQSTNVTKTPTIGGLAVQPNQQNVRRSSRLFSNNYSVKENNKSPNRNKFATPKSPSRKTKQRIAKNLNKTAPYADLNTRNRIEKEKTETVTSMTTVDVVKNEKSAIIQNGEGTMDDCLQQAIYMQKQSAQGLMSLLKCLGQAYLNLSNFDCKEAIEELMTLPPNQMKTCWVYSLLGLAHFEMAEYEPCVKYFEMVHEMEPYRIQFMDVYSTALWHLQREVALSSLAQDLIASSKESPVTWCVSGNCFSLHKEHDTAIKFFQRAVQVDPNFPYAYTLLGHEYITTEELDKALSCFRNAIRLDARHYNAWFGIGTIYSKQERYQLAEINYTKALAINPRSSVILCHIGVVQHALKETEKALSTLNMAIANNTKSPLCKFHRGLIYFALGRHAEALKELEELKEIVPKESSVYYQIGKVHKKLGNTDLALIHFGWATDLDPKGASSQIKEVVDPLIGRPTVESPASPAPEESASESTSGLQPEPLNFGNLPDDSEDSF